MTDVSLRRIRAGAGVLAISTVIQLWSAWLGYFAPNASGDPSKVQLIMSWLVVTLGASTWLLVQPWRRRVMTFTVVEATLWTAFLALMVAGAILGPSNLNVGLELSAFAIGTVGLGLLPFAVVWSPALTPGAVAGMTLVVGLASTTFGGAHLLGVIGNASRGAYLSYDFRLASMLSIGIMMVVAGTLCIAAVRGLARGQPRAWDLAMGGTVLLLLVTMPLCFVPGQGDLAALLTFLAAPNLVLLLLARRRLEAPADHQVGSSASRTSGSSAAPTSGTAKSSVIVTNPDDVPHSIGIDSLGIHDARQQQITGVISLRLARSRHSAPGGRLTKQLLHR